MDPVIIPSMIFTIAVIMLIGGFVTLFPVTRRLGAFLESKLRDKQPPEAASPLPDFARLLDAIQGLESEVRRLNERQEFTERLLAGRAPVSRPSIAPAHEPGSTD
jgi:hypothetical protein